jgi:thiol-disulfide isomerase/thioredoxin
MNLKVANHRILCSRPRLVLISLLLLVFQTGMAGSNLAIGDIPPPDLGRDLEGNKVSLEDFRGRTVVVSFWASWCPPCRAELNVLEGIQAQIDTKELRIIATNVLEPDQRAVRGAIGRLEDAQLLYAFDRRNRVSRAYNIKYLPRLMILDRQGRVAHLHTGYDESFLDQIIEQLNTLLASQE